MDELTLALAESESSGARVVILTGEGQAFCAGMDLEDLRSIVGQSPASTQADARHMANFFHGIYSYPLPLIAAVNGAAHRRRHRHRHAGGFHAGRPEAKFGYTEVRIGFLPAVVSIFLRRQVGDKRARDLLLSARLFDAAEAHSMGLVTRDRASRFFA